jgi:hypothetical protein
VYVEPEPKETVKKPKEEYINEENKLLSSTKETSPSPPVPPIVTPIVPTTSKSPPTTTEGAIRLAPLPAPLTNVGPMNFGKHHTVASSPSEVRPVINRTNSSPTHEVAPIEHQKTVTIDSANPPVKDCVVVRVWHRVSKGDEVRTSLVQADTTVEDFMRSICRKFGIPATGMCLRVTKPKQKEKKKEKEHLKECEKMEALSPQTYLYPYLQNYFLCLETPEKEVKFSFCKKIYFLSFSFILF